MGVLIVIADRKKRLAVLKSIEQYKNNIIKDINLVLRIVDEQKKMYKTTLNQWENDELTFEAPIYQCDWVIFNLPTVLELCFITNQSIYMTHIELRQRKQLEGKLIYSGKITEPLVKKQQRAHFRLATLCPINYRIVPDIEATLTIPNTPFSKGTTVNISVGGLCMVSDEPFKPKQTMQLQFHFLEHDFDMRGVVLEQSQRNPNGTFTHRIRFVDIDSRKENLLSKLIFEKQRLLMQSSRVPLYKS